MRLAAEQPHILKDPAPLVTFESFGDSSLNFVLRAYLPALDQRLNVISDLHASIHNELARAGIEIPFPQRDLHLKSWPAELDRVLAQPEELYQHDG
jgi:potassium-dependent mechanosensitive channel